MSGISLRSRLAWITLALLAAAAVPRTAEAACPPGFTGANCDQCLPGYYGPSCLPCPGGGPILPCSGNGACSDGISGTGACTCVPPYQGPICQSGVSGLDPTHGPGSGGTNLRINGVGLGTSGSVTIGGAASSIVSWTGTQIICVTPPGYGQNRPVTVMPSGGSAVSGLLFDYDLPVPPAAPAAGPLGRGAIVALMLGVGAVALARFQRVRSRARAS